MRESDLVKLNANQLASSLVRAICTAQNVSVDEKNKWRMPMSNLHMHDGSQTEIAWNDVQAIQAYVEFTGENVPIPLMATEGYNQHGHTGPYDGGWIPGMGPHDHRDNFNGGFAFAVFHPGTAIPQMPWSI